VEKSSPKVWVICTKIAQSKQSPNGRNIRHNLVTPSEPPVEVHRAVSQIFEATNQRKKKNSEIVFRSEIVISFCCNDFCEAGACWWKLITSSTVAGCLGSILWSQFSAIFANFRRKNWRFSQKPMLWSQFLQILAVFCAKNANIFAKFFVENIFKIITSVPGLRSIHTKHEFGVVRQILVSYDIWQECPLTVKNHLPIRWHLTYNKIRIIPNFVNARQISEFVLDGMNLCRLASWCHTAQHQICVSCEHTFKLYIHNQTEYVIWHNFHR
jgi:hypothetical protein